MEESNNQYPKPINDVKDIQSPDQNNTTPPPLGVPSTPPLTKKSHKKGLILIIALLVLIAGGAAAYIAFFKNSPKPAETPQTSTTQQNTVEEFPASRQLYYQLGNKVVAYDTQTKEKTTLTDKIPTGANVLDLFVDGTTWRLYYTKSDAQGKTTLSYVEKDQSPQQLVESGDIFATNAEKRLAAYQTIADYSGVKTSKTYVRQNGKSTLVYESDEINKAQSDLKDSRYFLVGISPDATKLLYQKANCHNCDGGVSATSMELNLATKKTTKVYTGTKGHGGISYFGKGYLIGETNMSALGYSDVPYTETSSTLDKPAGTPKTIFDVNEADWAGYSHDTDFKYVAVENKLQNYAENGKTVFDAIYEVTGTTSNDLKKVTVTGTMPVKDMSVGLGSMVNDCLEATFVTRSNNEVTKEQSYIVGTLCKNSSGGLAYSEIDKLTFKTNDDYTKDPTVNALN